MSGWNHRLVEMHHPNGSVTVAVQEVYYDKVGRPWGYCEAAAMFEVGVDEGDPVKSVSTQLVQMLRACNQPILIDDDERGDFKGDPPTRSALMRSGPWTH